jgi:hypothetical protein
MRMIRCSFLPLFLFLFLSAGAQTLTGVWEGSNGYSASFTQPDRVVLELYEFHDSITGVSHLYYSRGRYEHHKLSGWINRRASKVYISEDSIISYKLGLFSTVYEGVYSLKLFKKEDAMILQGDWTSKKKTLFMDPAVSTYFRKELLRETRAPVPVDTIASIPKRVDDIQLVIELDKKEKDSIRVDLYDNGEIDKDSVSVYMNERIIISKQELSTKPITFYISVSNLNGYDKIRVMADNLGTIPPNTALMVVTTRKKKYNVFVSSNFEKNAVIEFFLKDK